MIQAHWRLGKSTWGISSAGRAPALQAGGRRFDPVILHQPTHRAHAAEKQAGDAQHTQHQSSFAKGCFDVGPY